MLQATLEPRCRGRNIVSDSRKHERCSPVHYTEAHTAAGFQNVTVWPLQAPQTERACRGNATDVQQLKH